MPVTVAAPRDSRTRTLRQVRILAALVVVALAAHYWYGLRNGFFDLKIYAAAMRWWNEGHPLYGFVQADDTQGRLGYTYPPFAAVLMRPLAWLPIGVSVALYVVAALAALAVCVWWLVRPVADRQGWPRWFAFGIAFVLATGLEPVRLTFDFGQINVFLWTLILFDLLVLAPRGSRFLGVGIGLAAAIKLTPAIFVVYLLVSRRWRAAAVAAGTAVAATTVAAAVAPRDWWTFWTDTLLRGDGIGQLAYTMNQSVMGFLARLAQPGEPSQVWWVVLALPVAGYGMWRAGRAAAAGDEVTGLTLTGIVGTLLSPVSWTHHIFWFLPAVVVLVEPHVAVAAGLHDRTRRLVLAGVTYATVTFSMLQWWEFTLLKPGGVIGFVLSNWLIWLMLALLPLLPIRASLSTPRSQVALSA
jgi:alpha-1,2-mannosyltransferase